MAYHVELEFAAKTDPGLVRSHNEDSIAISPDCGLAIIADGMGGYSAGEVASGIATSVLKETLEDRLPSQLWDTHSGRSKQLHQLIVESIIHANDSIIEAARIEPEYNGMGTTLVAAFFHQQKVSVAHIGDSRAYRFRRNALVQITRDHSLLQEQIDAGLVSPEWARFAHNRNLVTRAMGVDQDVEVEIHDHLTEPGDLYLLCSDGLSDMLPPEEIADILNRMAPNLEMACDVLIQRANENGGRDNISVILARVQSAVAEPSGLLDKIRNWMR
jgi:PPM family protein phosphatase